ncbi:MAG: HYR domain-containing protein [Verrucomicrobiota bacterium]
MATTTQSFARARQWLGRHFLKPIATAGLALALIGQTSQAEDTLIGWGYNDYGMATVPALPTGVTFTHVSAGIRYFSLGVTSQGQGIGWGYSGWGNLNFPGLPAGVTYTRVAAGMHHSLALRSDGQVVAFGHNSGNGELNVPALPAGLVYTDVGAGYLWSAALRSDGQIIVWGYNGWNQQAVPALPAGVVYTELSVNYHYGLAIRSDGQITGFGYNGWGSLNAPALPAGVTYTQVSAGYQHTIALRSDGQVVAFGYNSGNGELNVPALPAGKTYTDIAAGYLWGMAVRSDGNLIGWGYNGWGNLNIPTLPSGKVFTRAFAGQIHALAIKHDLVSIIINGQSEMSILIGTPFTDPGASAQDELGNSLSVTTTGAVNSNVAGTYYITYSATDSAGNVGSSVRTVNVVKKLPTDLWVAMMPSYAQNPAYANVKINDSAKPITVWGRAWGGTPPYTFDLDFGDGTPHYTGSGISASAATFIGTTHVYASSGTKTATLTVSDSAGRTYTREAKIRVLVSPTHDDRVNMAIEKGLIHLYKNQSVLDAKRNYWNVYGWNHQLASGPTGAAVLAFEENGHLPGNDYEEDIYAETVQKGLNHILDFSIGGRMAIPAHSDGIAMRNSDWNGNGTGAYISDETYANTFGALAIVLSQRSAAAAQNTFVKSGPFVGMSYYELIQDVVEQYAWSQGDGGARGAYHYYPKNQNNGFDGSTMNWPPLLVKAAQDRWQIQPEAWYIENVKYGFRVMQNANGGIGYGNANHWVNIAKSGGILVGYSLDGIGAGQDVNVDKAVTYIGNNWRNAPSTGATDAGWIGEFYASYGMKKGLSLGGVEKVISGGVARDWYQDMSAWLLGDAALLDSPGNFGQNGYRSAGYGFGQDWNSGYWGNSGWISTGGGFSTAHAILILTKSVTVALPIPKIAAIPDQSSKHPANFTLDGSASTHADPNLSIVLYQWDWDASDGVDWNNPDATGQSVSVFPDWPEIHPGEWQPGIYTVTLRVTDNNNPANSATTTTTVLVSDTDVAPVAKPIPDDMQPAVYSGRIGDVIVIDGTDSYDPDGDLITGWAWDLDGNGTYGDAADAALDLSGNADGPTASVVFTGEYNGTVGLRVTANGKTGTSSSPVNIIASPSDLYVVGISAANVVPGTSADITAVVANAADSGKPFTSVNVRFYDGDPFSSGSQIGGNYSVNLPVGGSATVVVTGLPLSAGQELVYVFVDATSSVDEYDEFNNTASVNISNQPPVARCKDVTVSASASCSADASIDDGSFDPDATDTVTITQTPAGPYPIGQTTVTLTVTDNRGLSSTCTATVTVVDATAPVITECPADIVVYTGAGRASCDQVVSWTSPIASDNCNVASFTATHLPGDLFPIGTTTVVYTATDSANPPNSVNCSFTVTVIDNTPPGLVLPANIVINTDPGQCSAVVSFEIAASDNCPGVFATTDIASGAVFPTGTTTVQAVAVDAAGNKTLGSFTVTVIDNQGPALLLPANITVANDPGQCSAVVHFNVSATDNCAVASVSSDIASGATFPNGTTTITVTAIDSAGNTTTGTFTVTVNDTEAPVAACIATTNPSGKNVPASGNNPKSGQNPDGFYELVGQDNCDAASALSLFVKDSVSGFVAGPFKSGDKVKITQAPGVTPNSKPMAGAVVAHIQLKGDALLIVKDSSGNQSESASCLVAPKPK